MANEPREFMNCYWHVLTYGSKPKIFIEKAETQEIDGDYRFGSGWAIRFPFTRKAIVIGRWVTSFGESEALTYAIRGRSMAPEEVDWNRIRFGAENVEAEQAN